VVVGEDETAEAMVVLMERCKLVVEGAGAVGVAALLGGQVSRPPTGTTVACSPAATSTPACWRRSRAAHETEAGRRLVLLTRVPTGPGSLAPARCVAGTGANIVDVSHVREGLDLHVRETGDRARARDARARARRGGDGQTGRARATKPASCADSRA
jgi:threonine dehydratase